MVKPRANLPDDTFSPTIPKHLDRLAPPPSRSPQSEATNKKGVKLNKISIYLSDEQLAKLDELAYQHRRETGASTNRIDVLRVLIDSASLKDILK